MSPPGYSTYLLLLLEIHTYLRGIDKGKLLWDAFSSLDHSSPQPSRTASASTPEMPVQLCKDATLRKMTAYRPAETHKYDTHSLILTPGNFKSLLFNTRPELLNKTVWIQIFMFKRRQCIGFSLIVAKETADLLLLKFLLKMSV